MKVFIIIGGMDHDVSTVLVVFDNYEEARIYKEESENAKNPFYDYYDIVEKVIGEES